MSNSENKPVILICGEVQAPGIPSHKTMCSVCALELVISDSIVDELEQAGHNENDIIICCPSCSEARMSYLDSYVKLTQKQIDEITHAIRNL